MKGISGVEIALSRLLHHRTRTHPVQASAHRATTYTPS